MGEEDAYEDKTVHQCGSKVLWFCENCGLGWLVSTLSYPKVPVTVIVITIVVSGSPVVIIASGTEAEKGIIKDGSTWSLQ
jgi:uncharacterized Zn finger protein